MPNLPWMQFDVADWLSDANLSICQPSTRGIWIDAIAAMFRNGRSGTLTGTPMQLARVLRCTEPALMAAIDDLQTTGTADVTRRNGKVTLINRRMSREANERENNRLRQKRHRNKINSNGEQTQLSQTSIYVSSSSDSVLSLEELFKKFYEAYPRKENPHLAKKAFEAAQITPELLIVILEWLKKAVVSEQWSDKTKIPHPSTWLNQKRWLGDPPPVKVTNNGHKPDTIGQSQVEDQPMTPEYAALIRKRAAERGL
jgi:hypothetical protein